MEKVLGKDLYDEHTRLVKGLEEGIVPMAALDRFFDRYGTIDENGERQLTFEIAGK